MEEYFTVVWPVDEDNPQAGVAAAGCVTRNVAHSIARVPHATVQVIPYCPGKGVLVHQRPDFVRNAPDKWDVLGGHVSFEMGILGEGGLAEAYLETALREAREELLIAVNGEVYLIQKKHLVQIGGLGQFTHGLNDPNARNVEFSTVYVLCIPPGALIEVPFELRDGTVFPLLHEWVPWDKLIKLYRRSVKKPQSRKLQASLFCDGFADGLGRILDQVLSSPPLGQEIAAALAACEN
jgi:8-oxo-dGTP pyrophosphatase MutT (NUDIX family)